MQGISRLDLPARKMFLNDLQNAVQLHLSDSTLADIKSWKSVSNGDTSFSIVWVQGNVSEVKGDEFTLNDLTGTARVLTANVPSGCSAPSAGCYMMVIGQLESTGRLPVIHAMKLHNLSSNVALQTLWPLEVRDVRLHAK